MINTGENNDKNKIVRDIILKAQLLNEKKSRNIKEVLKKLYCIQYDPNPIIFLNQYLVLYSRIQNFNIIDFDDLCYKKHTIIETFGFKRNLFYVNVEDLYIYTKGCSSIIRWGISEELKQKKFCDKHSKDSEKILINFLSKNEELAIDELWEKLNLIDEWKLYKKSRANNDYSNDLPIFLAFYRLYRGGEILVSKRNGGIFRQPLFTIKDKLIDSKFLKPKVNFDYINYIIERCIQSFGATTIKHISNITGFSLNIVEDNFIKLENKNRLLKTDIYISKKPIYVHKDYVDYYFGNKIIKYDDYVKLISPMDLIVKDKQWLKKVFDYSFSFEYFKKKGMKWPLSILYESKFVGYVDCKLNRKNRKLIVKEIKLDINYKYIKALLEEELLNFANFHEANLFINEDAYEI